MNTVSVQTPHRRRHRAGRSGRRPRCCSPHPGTPPGTVGQLRRESFGGFDDGLVYRFAEIAFVFLTPAPWWFGCWWKHSSLKVPPRPTCAPPGGGRCRSLLLATRAREQSGRRGPAVPVGSAVMTPSRAPKTSNAQAT